ncbi:hypothetical protein AVEN_21915-1 [Araneus ventricosus]|uniref:Meiosis protein 5 homolog n=1 Tax=Araneus ventricosus TaxID=182803 RepID=A0A4Y2D2Q4_ARAVE|nr:hypothetical protein AVEN_21915-1 [Araneus ventricosus]
MHNTSLQAKLLWSNLSSALEVSLVSWLRRQAFFLISYNLFKQSPEFGIMADRRKDSAELSDSPHVGGHKMSSSLKERLKRSSRIHSSPFSKPVPSITSTPLNEMKDRNLTFDSSKWESPVNVKLIENIYSFTKEDVEKCEDKLKLQEIYFSLQRQREMYGEKLRKLNLVQKHQHKNKPDALVLLIQRWVTTAQGALQKLYDLLEPKPSNLQNLINLLQIDSNTIRYDPESDNFF